MDIKLKIDKSLILNLIWISSFVYLSYVLFSVWYTEYITNESEKNYKHIDLPINQVIDSYELEESNNPKVLMEFTPFFNSFDLEFINEEFKKKELEKQIEKELKEKEIEKEKLDNIKKEKKRLLEESIKDREDEWFKNSSSLSINIPKISLDTKMLTKKDTESLSEINKKLEKGVYLYPGGVPWDKGVSFIFWHSSQTYSKKFYSFFRKLEQVKEDDVFYIESWKNIYEYKIIKKEYIYPEDLAKKDYKKEFWDKKILALVTCTPVWTSKMRYVVYGELKEKIKK